MFIVLRKRIKDYKRNGYFIDTLEVDSFNQFADIILEESIGLKNINVFNSMGAVNDNFLKISSKFSLDDISKINKAENKIIELLDYSVNCKEIEHYVFDNKAKLC